ncbi:MAG: uracil-DNA glycosylase [Candidatus Cloacimonetes bacterium]|jgi:DNA polymerase|nr:uracil-DNA glycosylase [Candidatus Cloacimonadota bacterium]MDY0299375.1 uracil-DNA glycosylase [Candidatus Cloacimonadaceae bacterium]MCB5278004.1 uracil-DNA glycosylase [Candidatus Cloacimonadota bacterium]MCK9331933.1 uracil-DNA glycosylase [Candidatus Cloacimonadota bacterium]MDD2210727.1 uracil-DNA glycosylase [Candidatus Cloacimonadota bacterium]
MSHRALIQYLELLKQSGIRQIFNEPVQEQMQQNKQQILDALQAKYANCHKCPLAAGRINLVYGEGNPHAKAMLIGEAPGEKENLSGHPFVGAAGKLLDKMLLAIHLSRDDIYITNIVKCRPEGNRNPTQEERLACLPYLVEQIQIIRPRLLLVMGLVAAQTLFGNHETLTWNRSHRNEFMDIPAWVTYHPAALLRNEHWKRPAWEDLQNFQQAYLNTD